MLGGEIMTKNKVCGARKRNFLIFFSTSYSFFCSMNNDMEEKIKKIGIDNMYSLRLAENEDGGCIVFIHTRNPICVHTIEELFDEGIIMAPHDSIREFMECCHQMLGDEHDNRVQVLL